MNMNQFTQKSLSAIQGARDLAQEYGQVSGHGHDGAQL